MPLATYPISLPSLPGIVTNLLRPYSVVGTTVSPFSLVAQTQVWPGQQWQTELSLPKMARPYGAAWAAAWTSLNGIEGSFLIGDTANKVPRGVASGTPQVNGAGQTGYNLNTKGWTASITGILKAGDWIQLGSGNTSRLYQNIVDANSDGSGLATLTLWPQLRTSPANSDAIVTSAAKSRFMLTKPVEWTIGRDHVYTFGTISAVEDLRP